MNDAAAALSESPSVASHPADPTPATAQSPSPLIERPTLALWVENVTVNFSGFKALNELTLTIDKGELRCIIGPNGAGKTTLIDVITGKTRPTEGFVYLENREHEVTSLPEWKIAQMGVGRKFQRPTVFQGHTVEENLDLAIAANKGVFATLFSRQTKAQREKIDEVLEIIGLTASRKKRADSCLTATSSGSRSACSWCSSPRCCSSTSRSPG